MKYVESVARTNKLYCSQCDKNIKKGDDVVFYLTDEMRMKEVYCEKCGEQFCEEVYNDSVHPFSDEAF